jgi:hypothetical protein
MVKRNKGEIIIFFIFLLFYAAPSYSQGEELEMYRKIYKAADSVNKTGKVGFIDSFVFKMADSLGETHPAAYFQKTAELEGALDFNGAAFLYYLGYLRYSYYNSSNPDYQASADGALFASLHSMIGEPVNIYMHANIDNFISILDAVIEYYRKNDFKFYPRNKDLKKYDQQWKTLKKLTEDLQKNKAKYLVTWENERKEIEADINK